VAVLEQSQFELAGAPVFGRGCPIEVTDVDWGAPEATTADVTLPGRDGTVFGRDTHAGVALVFTLVTNEATPEGALGAWSALASAWSNPALREDPRTVTALRLRSWGGPTRVVYGRPRAWDPANTQHIRSGVTSHTAEFVTSDSTYYSDTEQSRTLTLAPDLSGGFTVPMVVPLHLGPTTTSDSHLLPVGGDRTVWPVITITGPVANPAITWLSTGVRFAVQTVLAYDQALTIDTRPWAQTVLRSDGASLRGACSPVPMRRLGLPPGGTTVQFTGQDPTGASSATIRWRDAYSTPGGTT
jgi:hypothetical protein